MHAASVSGHATSCPVVPPRCQIKRNNAGSRRGRNVWENGVPKALRAALLASRMRIMERIATLSVEIEGCRNGG